MVTLADVARKAKVSPASVSYVLNQAPKQVAAATRKRVLAAARQMNYRPRSRLTATKIGLLVSPQALVSRDYYQHTLLLGLLNHLGDRGVEAHVITDIDWLRSGRWSAGMVIAPDIPDAIVRGMMDVVPLIVFNRPGAAVNTVYSDHRSAVYQAVVWLARHGHRRIGLVLSETGGMNTCNRGRLAGYQDALKHEHLAMDGTLVQAQGRNRGEAVECMVKMFFANPTAVIAAGEGYALLTQYALYRLGKHIPDDVSVISYENYDSSVITPPHTTIVQDFDALTRLAVEKLFGLMQGTLSGPIEEQVPCGFIERESVKPLSA